MAKIANNQVFLDNFVAFNKTRYKDDTVFVEVLNQLTLDNVVIEGLVGPFASTRRCKVSSDFGNFMSVANDQIFEPGALLDFVDKAKIVGPVSSTDVNKVYVPGIYTVGKTVYTIVPHETLPENLAEASKAMLVDAVGYEIADTITWDGSAKTSTVNSACIAGIFRASIAAAVPVKNIPAADYGQLAEE